MKKIKRKIGGDNDLLVKTAGLLYKSPSIGEFALFKTPFMFKLCFKDKLCKLTDVRSNLIIEKLCLHQTVQNSMLIVFQLKLLNFQQRGAF